MAKGSYDGNLVVLVLLLILTLIVYLSVRGPSDALSPSSMPSLMKHGFVKLAIDEPEEIMSFARVFSAPIVFAKTRNLWTDTIVKNVLVDDQGQFGSCTASALSYAWQQVVLRSSRPFYRPSRCFWYAESRKHIPDTNYPADNGSTISDTAWALSNMGSIEETLYPYNAQNIGREVPQATKALAAGRTMPTRRVTFSRDINTTIKNFKTEIHGGRLIMIGVLVYSSFMTNSVMKSGNIPVPNTRRERLLGGHAIALSGWNETTKTFSFRNTWGSRVGQNGSFNIPYSYVCNAQLAGDPWVISL